MPHRSSIGTRANLWWLALAGLLVARLLSMALLPLMDTSEPRYAEIARTMLVSGDWITPWFSPGVPFWGKPPLSFWAQAAAMQVGGVNALAVRLPSLLATLLTMLLLYRFAMQFLGTAVARIATLMCASAPLMLVDAGAVLTDPFLTLGVTLSLVSLPMALVQPARGWRYGLFVGVALGLLAKGPLALILIGFPVLVWLWASDDRRACWQRLPWIRGTLLAALLSLPWYVAAELKTPGFLQYFLLGEHILRFIDPGWQGDLYGNGHQRPHGMIWLFLLIAALPWSLMALWFATKRLLPGRGSAMQDATRQLTARQTAANAGEVLPGAVPGQRVLQAYLLAWAGVCCLLFTPAGNILPTYVQPSLPALCLLVAWWWRQSGGGAALERVQWVALAMVVLMLGATGWGIANENQLASEKSMIDFVQHAAPAEAPLVYLDQRPYSAQFYSRNRAQRLDAAGLARLLADSRSTVYVALSQRRLDMLNRGLPQPLPLQYRNKRFALVALSATDDMRYKLIALLAPQMQPDANHEHL